MIDAVDGPGRAARAGVALLRAPPGRVQGDPGALRDRELTAVAILAELGDARRFSPRAKRSVTPAWTSPSTSPISAARPGTSPAKDRPRCAGRYEAAQAARRTTSPDRAYYASRPPSGSAATAPASRSHASCSSAASHAARTRRRGPRARLTTLPRARLVSSRSPMPRGRLPACCCRHVRWTAYKDRAAATLHPAGTIAVGTAVAGGPRTDPSVRV